MLWDVHPNAPFLLSGSRKRSRNPWVTIAPWKIGMLICLPATSRSYIFLQNEAVLSPRNFATTHLTDVILHVYLPVTSRPMIRKIPAHIKMELALPPPPKKKKKTQMRNFMGMGFSTRKNQKVPGAHKTGAASSGPRIAGGQITDMRLFLT